MIAFTIAINRIVFILFQYFENQYNSEIENGREIANSLNRQIEGLKNVSNLFKVINFQVWCRDKKYI